MSRTPAAGLRVCCLLLLATPLLLLGGGCGEKCGPKKAVVTEVVDGDTVHLDTGDTVRLLMVNTPEITSGKNECYGEEARRFTTDLVEGKEVRLEYEDECTDRFQRLLAYVSIDGRELNALLVERGYACAYYVPPSGEDRLAEFEELELDARAASRGLWGSCQEITCQD
ncbi:MAG: thermonuclease family protein [Deltaproteobacteria bacterium]|nr:thermonuclease family protein [Deltaproteobacteria bacterium]